MMLNDSIGDCTCAAAGHLIMEWTANAGKEVVPADGVLARVLAEFRAHSEGFGDSYLLHDELETFNAPCYFY